MKLHDSAEHHTIAQNNTEQLLQNELITSTLMRHRWSAELLAYSWQQKSI